MSVFITIVYKAGPERDLSILCLTEVHAMISPLRQAFIASHKFLGFTVFCFILLNESIFLLIVSQILKVGCKSPFIMSDN